MESWAQVGKPRRKRLYFDREPLDDEDRLGTGREGPSHKVKEEEGAGRLLLLLLDPEGGVDRLEIKSFSTGRRVGGH